MREIKLRGSSLKLFNFMEEKVSRHKRSKSYSDPIEIEVKADKLNSVLESSYQVRMELEQSAVGIEAKKRRPFDADLQSSLKQEVLQLQRQLQDQFLVRGALEKALSYRPLLHDATVESSVPKHAQELIKEIAVLELEVVYLEQYLLSLYRKKFDQQISSLPTVEERSNWTAVMPKENFGEVGGYDAISEKEDRVIHSSPLMLPRNSSANPPEWIDLRGSQKLLDSSIHCSHSSLSQNSAYLTRTPPKAVDLYHSLPLSMLEQAQTADSNLSLADHLGTHYSGHILETPNWLSEEMIRCISEIYCELAEPPLMNHNYPSSPVAFSSSLYECSSEGSKDFTVPYCTMVKVQLIRRGSQKLSEIEYMLRRFRSLVSRLEVVDPRKMKHEEKLAFWINIHNALVMHAFLVYGIPHHNVKRISLLLKAVYNVGGQTITVDMIQSSILGCRLPRPGQWLWLLFSSKTKFKVGDARRAYAIEHHEPLLHFALCSGSYSDPAVRVYTSKRVFEELETAKEEYIQSTFSIRRDQKILLPKIVESFAKDSGLCSADLAQMVEHFIADTPRKGILQCQHKKTWKGIEWIPHNFTFRYMLSKELA